MADVDIAAIATATADSGDDILGVARPANAAKLFNVAQLVQVIGDARYAQLSGATFTGAVAINGSANAVQSIVRAHSTQTANLMEWRNNAGSYVAYMKPSGTFRQESSSDSDVAFGIADGRGIYSAGGGLLNISAGGGMFQFSGGGAMAGSGVAFCWASGGNPGGGTMDTGLIRNAAAIIEITNGSTGGGAMMWQEMTAPSAPATNKVVLYAEDNGSGKTRLMARFATGVAQQVAIEP